MIPGRAASNMSTTVCGREHVALAAGPRPPGRRPSRGALTLQRRPVVARAGELAVAHGVEAQQRIDDPLLVQRQALLVDAVVGRHRVGHQLGPAGRLRRVRRPGVECAELELDVVGELVRHDHPRTDVTEADGVVGREDAVADDELVGQRREHRVGLALAAEREGVQRPQRVVVEVALRLHEVRDRLGLQRDLRRRHRVDSPGRPWRSGWRRCGRRRAARRRAWPSAGCRRTRCPTRTA